MKKYISLILILIYILPVYAQKNKGEERSTPISEINFKYLDSRSAVIDNNVIVKTITYTDSLADSSDVDSFFVYIGDATKVFPVFMIDTTGRSSTGIRPWVSVQVNDVILVDTTFYYTYTNNVLQPFSTIVDTNSITNMTGEYNKFYANILTTGNDTLTDYLGVKVQVQDGGRGSDALSSRQIKYVLQFITVLDQRLDEENITKFLLKSAFDDSLNNFHTVTSVWHFTSDSVWIEHLVADTIRVDSIYVSGNARIDGTLNLDSAIVNYAEVGYLVADSATIDTLYADSLYAYTSVSFISIADTALSKATDTDSLYVENGALINGTLEVTTLIATDVVADTGTFDTVRTAYLEAYQKLEALYIDADSAVFDTVITDYINILENLFLNGVNITDTLTNILNDSLDLYLLKSAFVDSLNNIHTIIEAWTFTGNIITFDSISVDTILVDYINVAENIILNGINLTDSLTNVLEDTLAKLPFLAKDNTFTGTNAFTTITADTATFDTLIVDLVRVLETLLLNGVNITDTLAYILNDTMIVLRDNMIDSALVVLNDTIPILRNNMVDSSASVVADTLTDLLSRIQEIYAAYWKFSRIDTDTLMGLDSAYSALWDGMIGRFDSLIIANGALFNGETTINDTLWIINDSDTDTGFVHVWNDTLRIETKSDLPIKIGNEDGTHIIFADTVIATAVISQDLPHAYLAAVDSPYVLQATQNVWYSLGLGDSLWNEVELDQFTTNEDTLVISVPGDYEGILSISIYSDDGNEFEVKVMFDGHADSTIAYQANTVPKNGSATSLTVPFYAENAVSGSKIWAEIRNITNGNNPTLKHGIFTAKWLHFTEN